MEYKHIFGPVPSRRMGISLGVSPIEDNCCSYSCIYCQLGRTRSMKVKPEDFFEVSEIIEEIKEYLKTNKEFDVITIVGEGEPTLYNKLKDLILHIKKLTDKPIAVITNSSILTNDEVVQALNCADLVLPSLDVSNEDDFKKINRPHGQIKFNEMLESLINFSKQYKGQLWLETMLVKDFNDDIQKLYDYKNIISKIKYDRLYINTPVRPPAEEYALEPSDDLVNKACEILGGISINHLVSKGFYSDIKDDLEAIKSIIKRHPMNTFEIKSFLNSRNCTDTDNIISSLNKEDSIQRVEYKGYVTYRLNR
ncbi:radical SAM protein [Abyssisolibacter fermentans]|uniref:radical SAM protein n=1 Tax=Abyssisolibacter fermentans TaxID=1766203 RepID=UPI000829B5AE|nr:radical SAM protein [Abyssisolibacter fermentans]